MSRLEKNIFNSETVNSNSIIYRGKWNAATNHPKLPNKPTKTGEFWIVIKSGHQFGLYFVEDGWIVADTTVWISIIPDDE